MTNIENYSKSVFEGIKHIDDDGNEFWYARDLMIALEYKRWDKFKNVIENAKRGCKEANNLVLDHFSHVGKMINIAKGANRKIIDYKLSRYACYLKEKNFDIVKIF